MAGFRFRLERLLALRRMREGVARDAAYAAAARAARSQAERNQAAGALLTASDSLARPAGPVHAARLTQACRYVGRLRHAAVLAEARARKAAAERRQLSAAAVKAWRARKVLEHLRTRQHAAWTRAGLAAAQRELDDLSAAAHRRGA
jgi:hypothetical protein